MSRFRETHAVTDIDTGMGPERAIGYDQQVEKWRSLLTSIKDKMMRSKNHPEEKIAEQMLRDFEILIEGLLDGLTQDQIGAQISKLNRKKGTPPLSDSRVHQIYYKMCRYIRATSPDAELPPGVSGFKKEFLI